MNRTRYEDIAEYTSGATLRQCESCGKTKPTHSFSNGDDGPYGPSGYDYFCRPCAEYSPPWTTREVVVVSLVVAALVAAAVLLAVCMLSS